MTFRQSLALIHKPYKALLKILPIRIPDLNKMTKVNLNLVSLVGIHHCHFLKESLISLVNSWDALPGITIVSDGSISVEDLKKKFSWLGDHAEFADWRDCLSELDPEKDKLLITYANQHVFGKKLITIITNARKRPTLWCDSDVLWYKDFSYTKHIGDFFMQASEDCMRSYSKNMMDFSPMLSEPPFVNSGFVLLNGDLTKNIDLSKMLSVAIENPDHFSEQTMIAYSTLTSGGTVWSPAEIACFETDKYSVKPSFLGSNWIVRHYISPVRHIFWRDSFYSRIGFKQ